MKKIILACLLAMMTSVGITLNAQTDYSFYDDSSIDGFFIYNDDNLTYNRYEPQPGLPALPKIGTARNQPAPIGSGTILLTSLGIGYLTLKKKKKNRKQ